MFNSLPTARLGVPPTVLDLLLDPAAPRPRRDVLARTLDDQVRRLLEGQPMLTLRFGRVAGEMLRKYTRLGYVRVSDYAFEELGVGERTLRNYARLAGGLLGRPILRAVFLARRLEMSHVLLLLHLPVTEDTEWATRAVGMGIRELRAALKPRLPEAALQEREEMAVLELDLDPEPFVDWLNTRELACRRDGQDLVPAAVMERVLANYVSAAALPEQEAAPFLLPERQEAAREPAQVRAPEPAVPSPRWEHPAGCACCVAAPESIEGEPAENIPAELTALLPHDARKLAVLARELMQAREASELLQGLILDRIRQDRLYRDLGTGATATTRGRCGSRGAPPIC